MNSQSKQGVLVGNIQETKYRHDFIEWNKKIYEKWYENVYKWVLLSVKLRCDRNEY